MYTFETMHTKCGAGRARPDLEGIGAQSGTIEQIIQQDKATYANGVKILKMLVELQRKGVNVGKQKLRFRNLAKQFFTRQYQLRKLLPSAQVQTTTPEGLVAIARYVRELGLAGPSVLDSVKLIASYAFGGWVGVLLSKPAVSKWFDDEAPRAAANLKESELLIKALATLEPKEAAAVRADLNRQIQDGYAKGADDTKPSFFDKVENLALLGIGLVVATNLLPKLSK